MVFRTGRWTAVALLAVLCATGCATRFSPQTVRREILLQSGRDPLSTFELNLGRFTTLLMQNVLADDQGQVPFAGLRQLQLAVFEAPSDAGPALDVTRIVVRGWEPVIRSHDASRSAMVLIRAAEDSIGDLVVVGAGRNRVVYARLRGRLSRELPAALGGALRDGGPEEVRRMLTELADEGR